jgi:hypothetical protein
VLPDEPDDPGEPGAQRSHGDVVAAHEALNEARRLMHLPLREVAGEESLESTRIAYEMEIAEHRSTTERAHRAELAAKDATIAQLRYEAKDLRRRLAESEAGADRLRIALQVLTGRAVPEPVAAESDPTVPGEQSDPPHGEPLPSTEDG